MFPATQNGAKFWATAMKGAANRNPIWSLFETARGQSPSGAPLAQSRVSESSPRRASRCQDGRRLWTSGADGRLACSELTPAAEAEAEGVGRVRWRWLAELPAIRRAENPTFGGKWRGMLTPYSHPPLVD